MRYRSRVCVTPTRPCSAKPACNPRLRSNGWGHSDISTMMNVYSHVTPTPREDAVSRLQSLITGA